ncbi:MAG: DUF937 domain-containing protein [Acidimicrobiia bacterium]|nr:DUF937 domain-containing protein [Acidimicrobiia bacterium]MBT8218141.1 DUF937 domain-containing protein [Acidimicrobiia bacterium]NNF10876.1 DUF937 domain-containing protein [Acidimicrobiia bacterium]NNL70142.1 DUF937 domain-containing protein [Acidimicrobiia bacterium]
MDDLLGTLGGDGLNALGGLLGGADTDTTKEAVGTALPAILGALANNASRKDGADSLYGALQKDHDGSVLDNLGGFLGNPDIADGNGILGHVLGTNRPQVEQNIAEKSGLDLSSVAKLLPVLAPIVMSFLGKMTRQNNLDAGGLSNALQVEKKEVEASGFDLGGVLGMLDRDKDGDYKDDVMAIGGSWIKRLFTRRR